jgi:hypothetical protein
MDIVDQIIASAEESSTGCASKFLKKPMQLIGTRTQQLGYFWLCQRRKDLA